MRKPLTIGVIALAVLVTIVGMMRRPRAERAIPPSPTPVETALATLGTLTERLDVTGSIMAQDQAVLTSQADGRVTRVTVEEGDRVSRGQVLMQVDDLPYRAAVQQAEAAVSSARTRLGQARSAATLQETQSSTGIEQAQAALDAARDQLAIVTKGARQQERLMARNAVAQAQAAHDNALANLNRMKKLLSAGAVAQQQVDAAQTQYDVAKAELDTARQRENLVAEGARPEEVQTAQAAVRQAEEALRMAKASRALDEVKRQEVMAAQDALAQAQAVLMQARDRLANTSLRSPVDGYVTLRNVDPGQVVGAGGAPLLAVAKLSTVYFEAIVSETEVARVQPGQTVEVRVDALGGRLFAGRVSRVVPAAEQGSRSFKVRVVLANPGGQLRPGMFARGRIKIQERYGVVLVPKDALLSEAGSNRVMKVVGGRVRVVPVVVGYSDTGKVELRHGVAPGDEVIVSGQTRVNDGDRVRPVRTDGPAGEGEGEL